MRAASGSRIFRFAKFRDDNTAITAPPDIRLHRPPLEAGDGGGGVERLGTMLLAALVRVAGVAAAVRGDGGEPLSGCRRRARR